MCVKYNVKTGSKTNTVNRLNDIALAITIPISGPILNLINIRAVHHGFLQKTPVMEGVSDLFF